LVLKWQPLCVLLSLPHASAETSNTDSNLKVGVVYGFFTVPCSRVFSFEQLLALNFSSPIFNSANGAFAGIFQAAHVPVWRQMFCSANINPRMAGGRDFVGQDAIRVNPWRGPFSIGSGKTKALFGKHLGTEAALFRAKNWQGDGADSCLARY
jgi:hypothetical protein